MKIVEITTVFIKHKPTTWNSIHKQYRKKNE